MCNQCVRVWSRRDGALQRLIVPSAPLPTNPWSEIGITLGGAVLLLHRGALHELSLETLELITRLDDLPSQSNKLMLSPEDALLAVFEARGAFRMYALGPAGLDLLYQWPGGSASTYRFSTDGSLLLWEEDIPQQTGSDLSGFGVSDSRTGEILVSEQATCFREFAYFSRDETRLLFGNGGDEPPKLALPIRRDGVPVAPRRPSDRRPLRSDHWRSLAPFRDELDRAMKEPL